MATHVPAALMAWLLPALLTSIFWLFLSQKSREPDELSAALTGLLGCDAGARPRRAAEMRSKSSSTKSDPAYLRVVILASLVTTITVTPALAAQYEFDQRRTEVRFVYKMAYSTQRGRFTKVSGSVSYDESRPETSKIGASIEAASLTTGEPMVDNELKGPSFFNASASPVISFKSASVKPISPSAANVSGQLTINGISKPVTLQVTLQPHDDPALKYDVGARHFTATGRIERSAFQMTDYQSMVDDEIAIEIDAVVRPK